MSTTIAVPDVVSLDIISLEAELTGKSPQAILEKALSLFDEIYISFSGAEDVVLIDMAHKIKKDIKVFSLDTGRLHPETYQYIDRVRKHYGITIEVMSPNTEALEKFTQEKGFFSFYDDGHKECCTVRKVAPLRRKLATLDAWITGQRQDQSPSTRDSVPVVQADAGFSGPGKNLVKFNPLANWTSEETWLYIRTWNVPYNSLHERGFISIGCEPCTRPVLPNQHEREGRWWWEDATKKECGLHSTTNQK
jgi:phosphoadenosine phosphosulfate reductase